MGTKRKQKKEQHKGGRRPHPVSLLSGVGSNSQRSTPSGGMRWYTRLCESQMSGRVLGEERWPLATNLNRSGILLAGMASRSLRQVVPPSTLPAQSRVTGRRSARMHACMRVGGAAPAAANRHAGCGSPVGWRGGPWEVT